MPHRDLGGAQPARQVDSLPRHLHAAQGRNRGQARRDLADGRTARRPGPLTGGLRRVAGASEYLSPGHPDYSTRPGSVILWHSHCEETCVMDSQFTEGMRAARERVNRLHDRVAAIPAPRHGELFPETYEELRTALEELRVVEEELRLQNEALTAAQHEAEVERRRYHDLFEFAPDGYI